LAYLKTGLEQNSFALRNEASETTNIYKDKNSFDMMICVVSLFVLPAAVESHKLLAEFLYSGKSHFYVLEPCLE